MKMTNCVCCNTECKKWLFDLSACATCAKLIHSYNPGGSPHLDFTENGGGDGFCFDWQSSVDAVRNMINPSINP